ncbi:MAG: choice-of-anchor R domain-containing protein [Verrucomicrobiales bacterium]
MKSHRQWIGLLAITLLASNVMPSFSQEDTNYTLNIAPAEHGSVTVSPEMDTYPEGTEVTLTAVPDEGYRFLRWVFGEGQGARGEQGKLFTDNPHSFQFEEVPFIIESTTKVAAVFAREITDSVYYDNLSVLGNDPNGSGSALKIGFGRGTGFEDYPRKFAQRFQMNDTGNVTAVEFSFARLGEPGGRLIASVLEVDETTGNPGEPVGVLGEISGNDVPEINWCALPHLFETTRIEGLVDGLEPEKDYFLQIAEAEDDLPLEQFGADGCGADDKLLFFDMVPFDVEGQIGETIKTQFDWPDPDAGRAAGTWHAIGAVQHLRFRIEGSATTRHAVTFTTHGEGTVSIDPELDEYPVGTEVTLTAAPVDGHALINWTSNVPMDDALGDCWEGDAHVKKQIMLTVTEDLSIEASFGKILYGNILEDCFPIADHPMGGPGRTERTAQQFFTGNSGSLASMVLVLGARGAADPEGVYKVELWTDANGVPGTQIGVIDRVAFASFPARGKLVTFDLSAYALSPATPYFIVLDATEANVTPNGGPGVMMRLSSDVGVNGATKALGADDSVPNWTPIIQFTPNFWYLQMSMIEGAVPLDPLVVITTEDGNVTKAPDLGEYPIGSEVTVTATPEPGFEFVRWIYGDEETTNNPAIITVTAGAKLTPIFVAMEPESKPIDVEILPAMAIRWDSQLDQNYEVQSSPDLENWTTEAVGVEGTGEVMTHFFIREAREMYYRVLESNGRPGRLSHSETAVPAVRWVI